VKLDMSKAYDNDEWSFLEKMMNNLGFHQNWVKIIMNCMTTMSYRIKMNGELTECRAWFVAGRSPIALPVSAVC
jgi:hypothetical protein